VAGNSVPGDGSDSLRAKLGLNPRSGEGDRSSRKGSANAREKNRLSEEKQEEVLNAPLAGVSGSDPPASAAAPTGTSWLPLIFMLLASTLAVLGFAFRHRIRDGESPIGTAVRFVSVAVVLSLVLIFGAGNAFAAKATAPKNFYGMMSVGPINDADAARMAAGGVASYRMPFSWDQIQAGGPGTDYSWGSTDPSVAAAAKAGVRILPILLATPKGFANRPTVLPIKTSTQRQGWASFLRGVLARYGSGGEFWDENPELSPMPIRTLQIWNEANFFYFATPVSPPNYVNLLKLSDRVISKAEPKTKIMLSGLYGSPRETPGKAMKASRFLDKIYKRGARKHFDSVAIHPYTPNTRQLRRLLKEVRATLISHGARKTPMHVTEVGWGSDRRTVFGKGSPAKQASQLRSGYGLMLKMRRYLNLRSAYWFAWKDVSPKEETCNFCYASGLFHAGDQLKPKPAWKAFVRTVKWSWR
jgi:hypothetical protein